MRRINVLLALSILLFNASCSEEEDIVAPVVESEPEIEYEQPVADFLLNVYSSSQVETPDGTFVVAPAEVWLFNESKHSKSYAWSFGDGGESSDMDPEYTYKEPGSYQVSLSVEGAGGKDEMKQSIEVVDFADLMVGDYIYEASIITDSGQKAEAVGKLSISKFGDEFKINLDDSEEVIYSNGWERNDSNQLEFNVDEVNRFDYQIYGYRGTTDFHGTFYPEENGLFLSLDVEVTDPDSEDHTIFIVAEK